MQSTKIEELRGRIWSGRTGREDLVQRVANSLRDLILSGQLQPGNKLAGEAKLAAELQVSRPSLREAIRILAQEGLLDVRHGVGTFVIAGGRRMTGSLELMRSMTDMIRDSGGEPSCRDLQITREVADEELRKQLELPEGGEVARIERVRLVDDRPFVWANEYIVLDERKVTFEAVSSFDGRSLYRFMREDLEIVVSHSQSALEAVPATAMVAQRLDMPRRAPLLRMSEVHRDADHRAVLLSVNYHNSEVIRFTSMRWGMPL
ncbi:Transcriptional regulator [Oceanicola granulosus HTCC2516]|uniref:Transcriptional regulator n=1 Tax=Oceanicola granulosus (strain ATCC BAA-861 / DSM 15982 / KCTC 12143 / HTCC2516) TaxID=314256 RepID=Q2CH84_OCEGH|nr:GntR family transcriptional regulator [Oceanicola granulosus]EAR51927.1 Transcriptional regulator [Oceanicola granulosus HTCC2516]